MFSLRNSTSILSPLSDEDSFGWWIGVDSQASASPQPETSKEVSSSGQEEEQSRQPCSMSPVTSCAASLDSGCPPPSRPTDSEDGEEEEEEGDDDDDETEEHIELRLLSRGESRTAVCYTPERLIKHEEYRIRTPSPRFCPSLADLDTARARLAVGPGAELENGATRLARLLESGCVRCCPVRYCAGEVVLHTEHCSKTEVRPTSSLFCCDFETTQRGIQRPTDDSSGVSSVDGVMGTRADDWSCNSSDAGDEPDDRLDVRRISDELICDDRPAALEKHVSQVETLDFRTNEQQTTPIVDDCDGLRRHKHEAFRDFRRPRHTAESLSGLDLVTKKSRIKIDNAEPELQIQRLRCKIDQLQGSNKILYEEITSLRRDFAIDECKVNHLSEDVSRLHNEVHELRYLDDLLKLLKGELERISKRNWPFAIGNTKHGIEEINLVV